MAKDGSKAGRTAGKKKGRQDVKRHWKPSLGRWVETYDRRGEHASPLAARQTNRRYRGVLQRVDHLVSAHLFFRKDSTLDEKQVIEEAIPEALSLCAKQVGRWRNRWVGGATGGSLSQHAGA